MSVTSGTHIVMASVITVMTRVGQPSHSANHDKRFTGRSIGIAQASTGQGPLAAEFLLHWWTAPAFGGCDLTSLGLAEPQLMAHMVTGFMSIAEYHSFPDDLGYDHDFRHLIHTWRPPGHTL